MDLVIIGRPNVGKTLLMINFAAYLGVREIRVDVQDGEGRRASRRLGVEKARRELVSLASPKTAQVQSLAVDVPMGRHRTRIVVSDTPGIVEGIAADTRARQLAALTIERLMTAVLVCHIIDASAVHSRRLESPGAFDQALVRFGQQRVGYVLVANKMDRPGSHEGLRWIKEQYSGVSIMPVSSITRRGFRDLKLWIIRTLV